jgi:glycosyltransferase involved in cell wall biosynthesis
VGIRAGGVAETVVHEKSGILFDRQDWRSMAEAIDQLDAMAVDPLSIRENARRFDVSVFRRRFVELFTRLGVNPALYSNESETMNA